MKKLVLLFFIMSTFWVWSQNISVANFELLPTDLTANSFGTMVYDQNGDVCALIRVQTTEKGFAFEVGSIGVTKVDESKVGEIWVYVPRGVRKMSIRHQKLGSLSEYVFPVSIESARTYVMYLTTGKVMTTIDPPSNQQYVVFDIYPRNAVLELNHNILPLEDGHAEKFVQFGTYDYQVRAPKYHTETGKVNVYNPDSTIVVTVNLKPAFGSLYISGDAVEGAKVYIDDHEEGTAPITIEEVASGEHTVALVKDKYKNFRQTVVVSDGQTSILSPVMEPNYAHITFTTTDSDAEIWINQMKKGIGKYDDDFEAGILLVECRKKNHRSTNREINVVAGAKDQTIALDSPIPITGSLNITTNPSRATVYLDGKRVGESPLYMSKTLIGARNIRIENDGFADIDTTVKVDEGRGASYSFVMKERIQEETRFLYRNEEGLFGYLNRNGDIVIPCQWKCAEDFSNGFAKVKDATEAFGFIDTTGTLIASCQWRHVSNFSEGLAAVCNSNNKYGFIDKKGNLVIPYQWQFAGDFSNGLAMVVNSENKYSFIDKTGHLIAPCQWRISDPFVYGSSSGFHTADQYYFPCTYNNDVFQDKRRSFSEGLALVEDYDGNGYAFINKNGQLVNSYHQWYVVEPFSEGLAAVGYNNTKYKGQDEEIWGFINKNGTLVIPYQWANVGAFSEGMAWVQDSSTWKYGFISKTETVVIPCKWEEVGDFSEGMARVMDTNQRWGFIDKTGVEIVPCQWLVVGDFSEGMACVLDSNGKYKYIDKRGKIIPGQWEAAFSFKWGLARVIDYSGVYCYIDKTGKVINDKTLAKEYLNIAKKYNDIVGYQKSAELGNAEAQNNIGIYYYNGQGVSQSYETAVEWYQRAAEQEYAWAQNNLGYCYEMGQGVQQSYEMAVKWYQKAADQGNSWAQNNLGRCYYNGRGVQQSYETAVKWYQKAAEQGYAWAQDNLGYCYENGKGVQQSYETAVKWYQKAVDQGHGKAREALERCKKHL